MTEIGRLTLAELDYERAQHQKSAEEYRALRGDGPHPRLQLSLDRAEEYAVLLRLAEKYNAQEAGPESLTATLIVNGEVRYDLDDSVAPVRATATGADAPVALAALLEQCDREESGSPSRIPYLTTEEIRMILRRENPADTPLQSVLREVTAERIRQEARWGVQDMPNGTGAHRAESAVVPRSFGSLAELAKEACDMARDADDRRMSLVLLEEVFEALAEWDDTLLRAELVQVAAVAVKWVQMIDRRHTWNGADRLHGICRCGEGRDHVSHHPVARDA